MFAIFNFTNIVRYSKCGYAMLSLDPDESKIAKIIDDFIALNNFLYLLGRN